MHTRHAPASGAAAAGGKQTVNRQNNVDAADHGFKNNTTGQHSEERQ